LRKRKKKEIVEISVCQQCNEPILLEYDSGDVRQIFCSCFKHSIETIDEIEALKLEAVTGF